jgi:hypothetical protein
MSTPADCRAFAKECFEWADQAKTDDQRRAFLDMARAWTAAALRMEGVLIPDNSGPPSPNLDMH